MNDKIRAAMGKDEEVHDPKLFENAFTKSDDEYSKELKEKMAQSQVDAFKQPFERKEEPNCNNCMDTGFDPMGDGVAGECLLCPRS